MLKKMSTVACSYLSKSGIRCRQRDAAGEKGRGNCPEQRPISVAAHVSTSKRTPVHAHQRPAEASSVVLNALRFSTVVLHQAGPLAKQAAGDTSRRSLVKVALSARVERTHDLAHVLLG